MKKGIALYVQDLRSFPASVARALDQRLRAEADSFVEAVYVLCWPEYAPEIDEIPKRNRAALDGWRTDSGLPAWAWIVCGADQTTDASAIDLLDSKLEPEGWCLNIEKVLEGKPLKVVAGAAVGTLRPVRASLAGVGGASTLFDYRTLDAMGVECEWQAYFDNREGPPPESAVRELYRCSFVIPGWEYRHRYGSVYGWGKVTAVRDELVAQYDSYRRPGLLNGEFSVRPIRNPDGTYWGYTVVDPYLWLGPDPHIVGLLMGRAQYPRIRVALDITRAAQARPPAMWEAIAASARAPGASKRQVAVYLADNDPTGDRIVAIAKGAA